jgi:hypothetical protein
MPSETEADLAAAVEMLRKQCDENEAYLETLGGVPEDIRKGIAAIRTVLAALQLKPIETAPKDRPILLAAITETQTVACSGYWTNWHGGGWVRVMYWTPTHWMELPQPPQHQQKASEQ